MVCLDGSSRGTVVALLGSNIDEVVMSRMFRSGPKKWLLVKNDLRRDRVLRLARITSEVKS